MREHITQSNLIENVRDLEEVEQSLLAWEYLSKQDELTLENVLYTHKLIMTNLMPNDAGNFRWIEVTVGGRHCPSHILLPELMDEWLEAMLHWEDHDPQPMHVWFERIHPFRDGNGRTGRMLLWWHELKQGKKPTIIWYSDRWVYYDWF